jgi:hypothetical protein
MRPFAGRRSPCTPAATRNARAAVHVFALARDNTSTTPDQHSDPVPSCWTNGATDPAATCLARRRRPTSRSGRALRLGKRR